MVRMVLIGAGFIGESHLKAYLQIPNAQVVAVADVDAKRAQQLARLAGNARWTTDYREVIGLGDAVDICTPSGTHAEIGMAAAALGKHVHVEKPFTLTMEDTEQLLTACERAGVLVMAGQTERFKPISRTMKAAIERGELGKLVMARVFGTYGHFWPGGWQGWQLDPAKSGGFFLHLGIHYLDLLLWLFDRAPRSIYAQAQKHASAEMETQDYYHCVVKFQDDSSAIAELSYALPKLGAGFRGAMLVGTKGTAYHNQPHDAFLYDDKGLQFIEDKLDAPLVNQLAHFVECVEQGASPITTPVQIRTAMKLALAAAESAREGRVVEV